MFFSKTQKKCPDPNACLISSNLIIKFKINIDKVWNPIACVL